MIAVEQRQSLKCPDDHNRCTKTSFCPFKMINMPKYPAPAVLKNAIAECSIFIETFTKEHPDCIFCGEIKDGSFKGEPLLMPEEIRETFKREFVSKYPFPLSALERIGQLLKRPSLFFYFSRKPYFKYFFRNIRQNFLGTFYFIFSSIDRDYSLKIKRGSVK